MGEERNLRELFGILWGGKWLILLVTLLFTISTFIVSTFLITPVYTANVSLFVNNARDINAYSTNINDINASQKLVNTYIEMVKSESILDLVEQACHLEYTAEQISKMLTVSAVNNTEIFKISIKNENPVHARDIANTFAKVAPAEIQSYVEASSVKVIYFAKLPSKPSSPNVIVNTLFGCLISFLLMAGYILIKEIFNVKIISEEDITDKFNSPILSVIPQDSKGKNGADKILSDQSQFFITEAYKSLRTSLLLSLENYSPTPKIIGVTSALASEGKSTICINSAIAFAKMGARVLVVDADMRRPHIHKILKLSPSPGISNYLLGEATVGDVVKKTKIPNIDVVCSGDIPPNPSELLSSDLMHCFFERVGDQYDYIFMDSPAITPVTDSIILSKFATGLILITRHNFTYKKILVETVSKLDFANANLLGFVLNDVNMTRMHAKGYYKYQYKYKYDCV